MNSKIDNIMKKYNIIMQDKRMITLLMLIQGLFYIFMPKGSIEWDARILIGSALLYTLGLLIEYFTKKDESYGKFINYLIFMLFLLLIFLFIKIDIVIRIFDRIVGISLLLLGSYNTYEYFKINKNNLGFNLSLIFSVALIVLGLLFIIKPIELGIIGIRIVGIILVLNAISDFYEIYKKKGVVLWKKNSN